MKSNLFFTEKYKSVESNIKNYLNQHRDFLSDSTAKSTRAVGDAIQIILAEKFNTILGIDFCKNYSSDFARRAMADLAFEDVNDFYYVVDVKTHRTSTKFNMPNLTSVERLARFYENDRNYFVLLMVQYDIADIHIHVNNVHFIPIEFLDWNCLTIGALGWGQIQIANSNYIDIKEKYSRKKWMLELCDNLLEFYPKEIEKISKRVIYFENLKKKWLSRPE